MTAELLRKETMAKRTHVKGKASISEENEKSQKENRKLRKENQVLKQCNLKLEESLRNILETEHYSPQK